MERYIAKEIKEADVLISKKLMKYNNPTKYLNNTQIQILMYLIKHSSEEVCQKDLEIETHLKKASITGTLDSLQDKRMIIRKQSDNDKRKNIIVLSEEASKIRTELSERYRKIEEYMRENITEQELNTFYSVLERIKKNIE